MVWYSYLQKVHIYTRMYDECVLIKIGNSAFLVGEIEWNGQV